MVTQEQIKAIGCVLNSKSRPLKERFRALFTLKNIGGADAIAEISRGFSGDSALLKHELAYCLGQMQDKRALYRVKWLQSGHQINDENPYASVDPSPPIDNYKSLEELKSVYLDTKRSLFDRYRAMFSLRNERSKESVLALAEGLKDSSALFRSHEVAFVLGQLQDPCSIKYLKTNLEDPLENEMVRHECAEALGAIATEECIDILNRYASDDKRVVKESCEIALDMCEYENSPEFQYADALVNINKNH
ncbi:hypothetical protein GQX74_013420 [Glossina fuscipes]|nr:hypothetical protein GQX74_013420 [Glossina fuscipes]